ncbi:MAG: HU family DNA-binding protein [Rhodobacter sp.]|nr:HU family DNA-binding protein [Rhodobacter sp.]
MVRKTATSKKPANKPAAKAAKPEAAADKPATVVRAMGKRELIDRVVAASGIKKKAAKPVVEAMLKELGDALSRGETLNLQPFGKGIVKTRKELDNAEIVELRLRRSKLALAAAEQTGDDDTPDPRDPLAEAAE